MVGNTVKKYSVEFLLFAAAFMSFAYFYQGGGWNQNVRFAMIRSIVEEGKFSIDSYLVYTGLKTEQGTKLVRVPVRNAEFSLDGRSYAFKWADRDGNPIPVNNADRPSPGSVTYVEPDQAAVSGDLSFFAGHFHPNKAPGAAFASVPAYFALYTVERIFGADPDDWWTLTLNAWLTSVLSVGIVSALGCVLFYRLALKLSANRVLDSLLAAFTFGFGTLFLPYATALYEHNLIAVELLASFYLLYRVKESDQAGVPTVSDSGAALAIALSGLCAGFAAITNYIMVVIVVLLGCYLIWGVRRTSGWKWYLLGALVPLLLIAIYNVACFSTPFTTNYDHQNPVFKTGGSAFLDVFLLPRWNVLFMILFSPYRGLFITSPALLLGVSGLAAWLRSRRLRAEGILFVSILSFFLLFIASFNGWHGGWAVGPRYLVPALPFLALPIASSFARFFKTACMLMVLSVGINLLVTAVDPQAPIGNAGNAMVCGRAQWAYSPLTEYEWPLFFDSHPWPLLLAQEKCVLHDYDEMLRTIGEPPSLRTAQVAGLRDEIDADVRSGRRAPLLLAHDSNARIIAIPSDLSTFVGPVSVNPAGIYESWPYRVFPDHSYEADWNSFNAGEFLFERSSWSLSPLLMITGLLAAIAVRKATRSRTGETHAITA